MSPLQDRGRTGQSWLQETSNPDSWCSSVRKASCKFKLESHKAAKERCRRQKEQAASQSSSARANCLKCCRFHASRIRLYSHKKACKS